MAKKNKNIEISIDNLRQARRKLLSIDEKKLDSLEPSSQEEWANNLRKITININKLTNADLEMLSQEFKDKEQDLKDATETLKSDLGALKSSVQIIQVASGGLKTITKIINLLKEIVI